MTRDPADVEFVSRKPPPSHGPGSGKEAWVAFAIYATEANANLQDLIASQSNVIASLEAEVAQLRARMAERKPKGGRPPVSERTVAAIQADLAAGLSQRQAAARNGVSPMTVSRLAKGLRA